MRGLPKYLMIILGLLSLAILSYTFPTKEKEVFSDFFKVNAAVHPDLEGMFDKYLKLVFIYLHSVAKVYAVFPFYDVKCLCSGGQE